MKISPSMFGFQFFTFNTVISKHLYIYTPVHSLMYPITGLFHSFRVSTY